MRRFLSMLGLVIVIFISIYNKLIEKMPSNLYYALFIIAAFFILIGNFNKR